MDKQPIRVLLVEDDLEDARLVREILGRAPNGGFELTHATSLHEAIGVLSRNETDAVLLDLFLPDSQGIETLLQMRDADPQTPVIVLTGRQDAAAGVEAVHAGAQDYLAKGEITGRLLAQSIRHGIERAKVERERWALVRRERDARTAAEGALRSRDEILATVAHDLRNPLAAVNTTVSLLRQGSVPAEQHAHHLDVVLRSTQQMDRLIQDLLDVARIEGGTLHLELAPLEVHELLDDAVRLTQAQASRAGLRLIASAEPHLPRVLVDARRIQQVFSNLIGNAMRFSPRGGDITLRARWFGDSVLFSVADTGVGISSDELAHLFDRGWQALHVRRDGTGRGLAISKGIIAGHHGRIWAVSEAGMGSTFFFTLPPAGDHDEADDPAELRLCSSEESKEPTRPLRLLIVDDHAAIRHGLTALLGGNPIFEVVGEAASGEEAVARVELLRPDIVVMDLGMRGMGGIEATRRITASMPDVRVLALSAVPEEEALMPVLRAGGSGFVRKTTAHEDLLKALETVARDDVFLYPSGNHLLLRNFIREHEEGPLATLTEQERRILQLVAEGFNSSEIGKKMFLSPKTIDSYRSRLMRQLGLSRRSDLVKLALRSGLLRLEPESGRLSPRTVAL